jgi:hypothetical protein
VKTTFSPKRMEYTKRAHLAAREQFYGPLFGYLPMKFEDTVGTTRDLEYAIDCQIAVTVAGLRAPLRFSVQERFRDPAAMNYGDITITEWNTATDQPSELHKLGAQLFVYGFYDESADRILAGVALDSTVILRKLATGGLPYRRQSRLDQSFLAFGLQALEAVGAVAFKLDNRGAGAS